MRRSTLRGGDVLVRRPGLAALLVLMLASMGIVVGATSAAAEDPATLSITKSAELSEVEPGDTFDFIINVQCTTFADGCTNAQVVDQIPAGLTPTNVSITGTASGDFVIDGQTVTVNFTDPLDEPEPDSVGMPAGSNAEIHITVVVDDLPYSENGVPLTNDAVFSATNPDTEPVEDDATVIPNVPLELSTDVSKSFDPDSAMAVPGTPTNLTIEGTNTSDEGVTEMVITDPADPTVTPNTFDYFALTSLAVSQFPPNADQVQVDVFVDGAWVTGTPADVATIPGGVALEDIAGIRLTFTSSTGELIDPGASAVIDVGLEQRDLGAVPDDITVPNTVTSDVSRDEVTATDQGDDDYTLLANIPDVTAGKTITPDSGPHGAEFNAELTAQNTWTADLETLSLIEPASEGDLFAPGFDDSMSFEGFVDPLEWPDGATDASVTYYCADGTTEGPTAFLEGDLPADPTCEIARFRLDFTGTITPDESATVNITVGTDPDDPAELTDHTNTVGVEGIDPNGVVGEDEADDDFQTYIAILSAIQDKNLVPGTIFGNAGEWIVATLPGGTGPAPTPPPPFPDGTSTVPADQIVIQDPVDPTVPDEFWDAFDPTEIADVAILAGSTLTINYWDGDSWELLTGPIAGPTTFSYDILANAPPLPDEIGGLQFVFESETGFPPGTTLQPNIVFELSEDYVSDEPLVLENCAQSSADADNADEAVSEEACDTIEILPIDPDGGGNGNGGTGEYVLKDILDQEIPARTEELVDVLIEWGTGGVSGMDSMTISDVPDPSEATLPDSFFDAFDLVSIDPITPATDPLMEWDAVASVELYRVGQGWVDATNDPCPAACDGTFPGYTLTAAEQEDTIGVRLVFVEGSNRATTTDPTAPPVGSGVARSFDQERPITMTFRIRDDHRSDGTPVTGHEIYNEPPEEGLIRDDVGATAEVGDETFEDEADDVIVIVDVPLNVGLDKQWTGGPLGDPPEDSTAPEDYPSGRVTLTADNLTQARVDHLVVSDPGGTGDSPFDYFNLTDIVSVEVPAGTESWTATLDLDTDGDGVADDTLVIDSLADPTDTSPLTSLTAADLEDVVGISIDFEGRIDPDAQAVIVMDLQLRVTDRSTGDSIDAPPEPDALTVPNGADATVDDAGRDPDVDPPIVDDTATIDITGLDLDVVVDKQFGPLPAGSDWCVDCFSQTEPDQSQFGMLLSATPVGSARTGELVVLDTDPTFWNAYEFVGFDPSFTFTDPIDQVQIDVLTGGTFDEVSGEVVVSGATWVEGEPSDFPTLPTGVDPADVQGIRITYTREDGTQWENSEMPTQEIPIVVQRRDELLTGGPVPTDLAGNDPAPGESEPGVSTNTITGTATSYLTDGSGIPLFTVESDPATGEVLYEHATTAVEVEKTPQGQIPPGATTDFELTITNTGDWPIIDPVITDYLPVDADGPMLELDPDVDDPYAYALTGDAPDPANGLPMPTDPADVTATVSADGEEIQFTFPPGTVLEPGQTYTITVTLFPRPGVEANVDMTNSFGIVGERPFDECVGDPGLDEETGECVGDTVVFLDEAGALRSGKLVKADDPSLGVSPDDCVPDEDGFYGRNCLPITAPGDTETWRLELQNTGTVALDRVIAIDLLPAVGDTGAVNPNDRGSLWDPILVDALVGYSGPAATVTVYGTTDDPICTDDLTPSTPCPDGAWVEVTDATDLTTLTGLKYDVEFDEPLVPGDVITLDFQTQTPALSDTEGPDTAAYNSVATGGVTTAGGELLPTEGNRVGVILATGPLEVLKEVTGDGAIFAPEEVSVTVTCTSLGETVYDETFILPVDEVVTIDDLPYGSECVITEDGAGETSSVITDGTVGRPDDPVTGRVTIVNTYDLAGLEVEKAVESDAVDADGTPIEYGPFTVLVECTFLGDEVFAEGYGPDTPMEAVLEDGETFSLTGLPAGAECTVTETDTSGAASVTMTVTAGEDDAEVIEGETGDITLAPDGEGDGNLVLVTNAYDVGDLVIDKQVTGPGADIVGGGPFTFTVLCTLEQSGGEVVTWDGEVQLTYPDGTPLTIEDIAAGSECVVTETDTAGADVVDVQPANGDLNSATVTVGADAEVVVTATNEYDTGDIAIRKAVTGPGAAFAPDAFTVTIVCTVDGETVFEDTVVLDESNDYSVAYVDLIPFGAECVVTEEDAGQTWSTVVPGEAILGEDEEIEVLNYYALAELEVIKEIDTDAAGAEGEVPDFGPFTVEVTCEFLGEEVWGTGFGPDNPMVGEITADQSFLVAGLPAGAECTVTETDTAGAADTSVTSTAGDVSSFTYSTSGFIILEPDSDEQGNTVTFTNTFDTGALTIEKAVTGPGADELGGGPFVFSVLCTLDQPGGEIVTWDGDVTLGGGEPLEATLDTIAAGSECVVTETDSGGADDVLVLPDAFDPTGATVTVGAGDEIVVTARNYFAEPPSGGLAGTGFGGWWALALGGALAAAGATLLVARRR